MFLILSISATPLPLSHLFSPSTDTGLLSLPLFLIVLRLQDLVAAGMEHAEAVAQLALVHSQITDHLLSDVAQVGYLLGGGSAHVDLDFLFAKLDSQLQGVVTDRFVFQRLGFFCQRLGVAHLDLKFLIGQVSLFLGDFGQLLALACKFVAAGGDFGQLVLRLLVHYKYVFGEKMNA